MSEIHVLQNSPHAGPGYLDTLLRRRGLPRRVLRVDRGEPLPEGLDAVHALVVLGGRADAHRPWPWMEREIELIAQAARQGLPVLAHGLGAELAAQALGAAVVRNPVKRIGWFEVEADTGPASAEWLREVPARFELFAWHRQAFDVPPGGARILHSAWCPTEGFVHGSVLAVQGHLELTEPMLRDWLDAYPEELARPSEEPPPDSRLTLNWEAIVQGPDAIRLRLPERIAALHAVADAIYGHWLDRIEA